MSDVSDRKAVYSSTNSSELVVTDLCTVTREPPVRASKWSQVFDD